MSGHESSRKRMKMSRTEGKPTSMAPSTAVVATSSSAALANKQTAQSCGAEVCEHQQSLRALHTDIDAMRQLVTCKICDRLLYEPYALSCGHTYCYSCLKQWFENNPSKKTCPDCRINVTQQPTPSYLLREMVLIFVSRNELLPDGETADEHHTMAKEEADTVAGDRANTDQRTGGLFRGMFKRGNRFNLVPIRDAEDGVDRCPECHWELEGTYCGRCDDYVGQGGSDYDSDMTDDELDHDVDVEEDITAFFGPDGADFPDTDCTDDLETSDYRDLIFGDQGERPIIRGRRRQTVIDLVSSDVEDNSDEDTLGNLRGFVANDDEVEYAASDEDEDTDVPSSSRNRNSGRRLGQRRAHVVLSDDEGETVASAGAPVSDDDDSDSDVPLARGSQRAKRDGIVALRQRRLQAISSDEEDVEEQSVRSSHDHSDNESESHDDRFGGFSPLDHRSNEDGHIDHSDEESEASSAYPRVIEERSSVLDETSEDETENDEYDTEAATPRNTRDFAHARGHRLGRFGQHSSRFYEGPAPGRLARFQPPRSRFGGPQNYDDDDDDENRLPGHPFALDSTLANINRNHDSRQASSSSESDGTLRNARTERRRKRLLSISTDGAVEDEGRYYAWE